MEQDAVAPTLYSAFRLRLHQVIIEHLVGPVLAQEMFASAGRGAPGHLRQLTSQLVTMAAHNDTTWLPAGMDWSTLATQALVAGIADLRRRLGDDMATWQWGLVHHTQPRHPLSAIFQMLPRCSILRLCRWAATATPPRRGAMRQPHHTS